MDFISGASIVLPTGILTDFTSGFLGVGRGSLRVPVQVRLLRMNSVDPTWAIRIAFETSLAVVIPTALSSSYGHPCRHRLSAARSSLCSSPAFSGAVAEAAIATNTRTG